MIDTPLGWLAEAGIERFRLRQSPEAQSPEPKTQTANVIPQPAAVAPARRNLDAVVQWTVRIRNYRTVATLVIFDQPLSPNDFKALERLSNDIGMAVNGMTTQPLLQEQRFSSQDDAMVDVESAQRWLQELPAPVVLLAGECGPFSNLLIQAGQTRKPAPILMNGILSTSETLIKKRELWQALSAGLH